MNPLQQHLTALGACEEAIEWAGAYISLRAAWDACERADWLLWYAARRGVDRKFIVLAACACARTALPYVQAGDDRPRIAIETTEAWTRGDATLADVHAADAYASSSASDAYASYASSAAAAAVADASDATYASAASDAAATAYAAAASAAATAAGAYAAVAGTDAADARRKAHRTMCSLVRDLIPCPEEP